MVIKRITAALLVLFVLVFCGCNNEITDNTSQPIASSVPEDFIGLDETIEVEYVPYERNFTHAPDYFTDIPYVGLFDANSLEEFYSEQPDERIYPASLTKMVTASVAVKYGNLEDVYPVGSELNFVKPQSSVFGLRQGMRLKLHHLLYGLLLPSGNDAAYTIAVNVARSVEGNENLTDDEAVAYFCNLMNEYCAEIGAVNSHFTTPEGWDDANQYTTVRDLARIASYALRNDVIAEIVATPEIRLLVASGETFVTPNSNQFLHETSEFYNPDVTGIKTGNTDMAGACLVASVKVENSEYIAIAALCPDKTSRFTTVAELIEFAKRYHYSKGLILYTPTAQ